MVSVLQVTIDSAQFKESNVRYQVAVQIVGASSSVKTSISGKTSSPMFNIHKFNLPVRDQNSEVRFTAYKILSAKE